MTVVVFASTYSYAHFEISHQKKLIMLTWFLAFSKKEFIHEVGDGNTFSE